MIIPTIFSESIEEFSLRYEKLSGISNYFHIDFMDGVFVSKKSPDINLMIKQLKHEHSFGVHLMTINPVEHAMTSFANGASTVYLHVETVGLEDLSNILSKKLRVVLSKKPQTPLSEIEFFLKLVDDIMLMGVNPGFEGQELNDVVFEEINFLKSLKPDLRIHVDGGVNKVTAEKLALAGADILYSGSYVSKSENPMLAFEELLLAYDRGAKLRGVNNSS